MSMKCAVFSKPGSDLVVVKRPIPTPGPGEVLIKVEACGVCHSDCVLQHNAMPGINYPVTPGHEVVGRIQKLGENVCSLYTQGMRVGVGWSAGYCSTCEACRCGSFIDCEKHWVTGVRQGGGYAQYMVARQSALCRIPDELSSAEAAPLLCAGITVYNSMRHMDNIHPGDICAVVGIGGLGHLAIQYANKFGYRTVALSSSASKQELAKSLGAHVYIDQSKQDAVEELKKLGGAKLIVVAAPGGDVSKLVEGMAFGGTLLVVSMLPEPIQIDSLSLILKRAQVRGWPSGTHKDAEDALNFSALSNTKPLVQTYPLKQAKKAYEDMMNGKPKCRAVIVFDESETQVSCCSLL
ncbi:zinc-type alcohol dehydrogenase [Basidiobolus meristosporus CBS 931.73]|uniref:Zinc-type alcohol dehydrogenase n=1 Tax=Basidiobolus meristosporus CBS 931.73 TaxID=1314790 RepID=A0A1Y1ZEX9_9FUNG|nr:zinc-type alcohol dehydrogenase [Basidiobolus meristosporus CBS 931.73]|eukprot:ORY08385.1 zinc-type alcohol dehydrogenase [Basidiobolus meristosporus CBS 931.73]